MIPHRLEQHGHVRVDDYYWLNDRSNPEVLAYLQAENDYATTLRRHTVQLEHTLFDEIKGRIKQTDLSVPFKQEDYVYYIRYEEGKEAVQSITLVRAEMDQFRDKFSFYLDADNFNILG